MPRPLLRNDSHREDPLTFAQIMPAHLREAYWLPRVTVTLAWWPMGQGYTTFEARYSPQHKLMVHTVALTSHQQEEGLCSPTSNASTAPTTMSPPTRPASSPGVSKPEGGPHG